MLPVTRLYLLIVFAPLAVIVSGCVLLNMWVDPLNLLRDQRLSTRTYSLDALLTELERPTASEPDIDVFLLGTSRTRAGHKRPAFKAVNLGVVAAKDSLIDNLLVGLLQTSTRPHVYFVDAMGGSGGKHEGKTLRYLLAGGTTRLSLRHVRNEMRGTYIPAGGSLPDNIAPKEPSKENLRRNLKWMEYLRNSLPVDFNTRVAIEQRIRRIRKLSVPHDALVVYYEGSHSPWVVNDPLILGALQGRAHLWRQVLAELNASDVFSASEQRPRVTVAYASYATPAEWGKPAAPEVWSEANWFDAMHYNQTVGKVLLDRLMDDAAESWPSATETN